jgi:hypothetical protein
MAQTSSSTLDRRDWRDQHPAAAKPAAGFQHEVTDGPGFIVEIQLIHRFQVALRASTYHGILVRVCSPAGKRSQAVSACPRQSPQSCLRAPTAHGPGGYGRIHCPHFLRNRFDRITVTVVTGRSPSPKPDSARAFDPHDPIKVAQVIILSSWIVMPPVWFWWEFFRLYISAPAPKPSLEEFKYGRDQAAKIWLALITVLLGLYFREDFTRDVPAPATRGPLQVLRVSADSLPAAQTLLNGGAVLSALPLRKGGAWPRVGPSKSNQASEKATPAKKSSQIQEVGRCGGHRSSALRLRKCRLPGCSKGRKPAKVSLFVPICFPVNSGDLLCFLAVSFGIRRATVAVDGEGFAWVSVSLPTFAA